MDTKESNAPVQQTVNVYLKNYYFMRKKAGEKDMSVTRYINNLIEEDRKKGVEK